MKTQCAGNCSQGRACDCYVHGDVITLPPDHNSTYERFPRMSRDQYLTPAIERPASNPSLESTLICVAIITVMGFLALLGAYA